MGGSTRSQEVGDGVAVRHIVLSFVDRQKDLELTLEVLVDLQDGGNVTASVAVVGSGPDRDQTLSEPVLESVHDQLMRASNKFKVVDVIKFVGHAGTKEPACTTGRQRPGVDVLGVGPHEIREGSLMGQLHPAFKQADLI